MVGMETIPPKPRMRVLVACEFSNTVRDAFLRRGHDAYSCDLERADYPNRNFERHIRGDVRPLLRERWDLVIAHPPCTHLAASGAVAHSVGSYQYNPNKHKLMLNGAALFIECLYANSDRICVENPIMLGKAKDLIGVGPTQTIQPWWFGHQYSKATCLWLTRLPPLVPTNIVNPICPWVSSGTDKIRIGKVDPKERSRTFQGIADAMAAQWG